VLAWAIALALLLAAPAEAAAKAQARPARAAIVFLPSPPRAIKGKPFLKRVEAVRELSALGYVSAIQGTYTPEQVLLDISSGSRVTTALYDVDLPEETALSPTGAGGRISTWPAIAARARTPPADVDPGVLGQAVLDAGRTVGYVGLARSGNREALVAADRSGAIQRLSLGDGDSTGRRALALWRRSDLLVVKLPRGPAGRSALRMLLAARATNDLVIVMQDPNAIPRRLLAAGAAGLGGGSDLRSDSTRTDGLVVSTDLAPTVLERVGAVVPGSVAGEPMAASGSRSADQLVGFRKRLGVVGPRRWAVVLGGLAAAVALIALASVGRLRRVACCAPGATLWLPAVLLLTGAIAPIALVEVAILAGGCAALALATDRLVRWPRSIAVPAAVTILAHVFDLTLGSKLITRSLLGPNPLLGARFYGIGNELEITLAIATLLGLGGALIGTGARTRVWGFGLGGGAVAFLLSWGRLGADVGAVLTLGVGTAAAAVIAAERGSRRTRGAIVLAAPALALAALAALDLATGGNAHFTRSVLRAGGLDELGQVAQRRFELSYSSLGRGAIAPLVGVAFVALLGGLRFRRRLLARLQPIPALRAGFYGALAAVVGGALTNDSGPVIFLIGMTYLALAVGYVLGAPNTGTAPVSRQPALPRARTPR
jgi:hypothetical protein